MRVHFVNRFYWPSELATAQLLTDLAESLAEAGGEIAVVAGRSSPELPRRESRTNVAIHRVGPRMAAGGNVLRRAFDFAAFHLAASWRLWRTTKRGDVVVVLTDPPLIGITAAAIAALRGARVVHWIHDIYPEVVYSVAPSSGLLCHLLRPLRNAAWRRAAACVTLGEEMAGVVRAAKVATNRISVVPNWAPRGLGPCPPAETRRLRSEWSVDERFVVGYSGNLGRVHDLTGLLDVAENLREDRRFAFVFVGQGAGLARLREEAEARALANVRFLPPQPRAELTASLSAPDLHVISLREGCERFVFPSKLYGAVAVGRPVLVLAAPTAEIARLVEAAGIGAAFRPSDAAGITRFLRSLAEDSSRLQQLSAAALRFDQQHGGPAAAIRSWTALLERVAAAEPASPPSARGAPSRHDT
jgi:glycosyltransferase involved in cell wall biosynthesis